MKTRRTILTLLTALSLIAVLLPTTALAQAGPTELARTITVVGEGTVRVSPNAVEATVGVDAQADSVMDAVTEVNETMEDVIAALEDEGIDSDNISTSGFNVFTDRGFGPESQQQEPVYRASNTARIMIEDVDSLASVLEAAISAGANTIQGVNFTVSNTTRARAQARIAAMADAETRAEALADLAGVEVGQVISVSEVIGGGPVQPFARDEAVGLGGGGFSPGQQEISTRIQVVYAID